MQKEKVWFWLIFVLVLGLCTNLWAIDRNMPVQSAGNKFGHKPKQIENSPWLQKEGTAPITPDLWLSQRAQKVSQALDGTGAISGHVTKAVGGGAIQSVKVYVDLQACPFYSAFATTGSDGY